MLSGKGGRRASAASARPKCAACGRALRPSHKFCPHCGAPLATATAAPLAGAASSVPLVAEGTDVAEALHSFVAGRVGQRLTEVGVQLATERRLVTALFADISGFTKLADRLDPEQLLEVIDPVVTRLANVVRRYEGYVEKFAGDALLALFGAPVSHEDDAERAVLVALEMQRELEPIRQELLETPDLTLHIGINTGHGIARMLRSEVRTDYAVLGDSVILAQRLQSAAPSGQTYVSDATYQQTKRRFDYELVGDLMLKGKAEPVRAWRLVGEREEGRRAIPRGRSATSRLVGREQELAALGAPLARLARGKGALITLTGEPGIGKSRLTEEVKRIASAEGIRWLEARCLSYGAGLAYWPYAEMIRSMVGIWAEDVPSEALSRLSAVLNHVGVSSALPLFSRLLGLPDPANEAKPLEPEAFRRALHTAFVSWARALARETPTVIALEDVHWADASTLAVTAELARLCTDEPIALYLTARPEAEPALAGLGTPQPAIRLASLNEAGVAALIENVLGGAPPRPLSAFVMQRTAGNPFFVEELLRSLLDMGALEREEGVWRLRAGWDARNLPPTLEGVLSARIDLLPLAVAKLLKTASVIGRRVRLPLLRAVTGTPAAMEKDLEQLIAAGFLDHSQEDGTPLVVFHHALVQDVAYSRLLRRARSDLHHRVAEAAESLYGAGDDTIDLLARHLYLGKAGAKALDYLLRAGERAKRLFANDQAILHLGRAVELARDEPTFASRLSGILLDLADLDELVGRYDDALRIYGEVQAATNDLRAWHGIASTFRKRGEYSKALDALDAALKSTPPTEGDLLPLRVEQARTLAVSGRLAEADEVLRSALETSRARRDAVVGQLLLLLARVRDQQGKAEEALAHAQEARQIFEERGDLRGVAMAMRTLGGTHIHLARLDEAVLALRRGLEVAERVGAVDEIGSCLINLGVAERRRGNLEEAIACDRQAIAEFERVGHQAGRAQAYANLTQKLVQQGALEAALEHGAKALQIARSIGHRLTIADVTHTVATIHMNQGRLTEAATGAEEAAQLFLELGAKPRVAESLTLAADAWERAGERARARTDLARAREVTSAS